MSKNILVTGGSGTLGTSLQQILTDAYYPTRADFDLLNPSNVFSLFRLNYGDYRKPTIGPDIIIHASAKVGGIIDNINYPEDYFFENVTMDTFMIKEAINAKIKYFTAILSTCAYPNFASSYPMTEDMLHDGPPAPTNFAYGYAKRAMAVHIDAANAQYGTRYNYLIPCNLYSGKPVVNQNKAHFLDMLIHKIREAKKNGVKNIDLMGSGIARRQFMPADDLARVIKMVIDNGITESFNVCPDYNPTIRDIVNIALDVCDARDLSVFWDTSKPDGQVNKQASNTKFKSIFPDFKFTSLHDGIREAYEKYL